MTHSHAGAAVPGDFIRGAGTRPGERQVALEDVEQYGKAATRVVASEFQHVEAGCVATLHGRSVEYPALLQPGEQCAYQQQRRQQQDGTAGTVDVEQAGQGLRQVGAQPVGMQAQPVAQLASQAPARPGNRPVDALYCRYV